MNNFQQTNNFESNSYEKYLLFLFSPKLLPPKKSPKQRHQSIFITKIIGTQYKLNAGF